MLSRERIEYVVRNIIKLLREDTHFSGSYSSYTLSLLFLKWLLDLHGEDSLMNKRNERDFILPEELNWSQIRGFHSIGKKLTNVFSRIEELNPKIQGIFINPSVDQWEEISDHVLQDVIRELSALNFDENSLQQSSLLVEVYEEAIIDSGLYSMKSNVNYLTPRDIAMLMINFVQPQTNMQIYDPACGTGGILVETARHIMEQGKNPQTIALWGQEEDYELRSLAYINLLLHGISNSKILPGNIIKNFPIEERGRFDLVITNPPFGVRSWQEHESSHGDSSHIFKYGRPPKSSADYAFIQHVLALLNGEGKAAMIVPNGVLFRGGMEGKIRENIIKDDLIEAIIGLPENLFYNTKISTAIILFNKKKVGNKRNRIFFVDASHDYKPDRKRNFLTDENISKLVSAYSDFREEAGYSRIVSYDDVSKQGYVLTVSCYVEQKKIEGKLNIDSQVEKMQKLEAQREKLEAQMDDYLKELGVQT
jgi:type I restriction enzyme M protein